MEEIRAFRNALAGKYKVQPSAVFPDDTIELLYKIQPVNLKQLIGQKQFPAGGIRIERYGTAIIDFFSGKSSLEIDKNEGSNVFGK